MKKFVSLLLAALMLLGSTAFAQEMIVGHDGTGTQEKFVEYQTTFEEGTESTTTYAKQSTDVWLQVTASGQIDVTVPLVVVFKTNIDGGVAETTDSYKFINHSTAALKVTKIVVTDQDDDLNPNGVNTSDMKPVAAVSEDNYNEYNLQIKPAADDYKQNYLGSNLGTWQAYVNVFDSSSTDMQGANFTNSGSAYTMQTEDDTDTPNQDRGLWRIPANADADNKIGSGADSIVDLKLETSRLSFVTKDSYNTNDFKYGVHLVEIMYTVKIDDYTAIGTDIAGVGVDEAAKYTSGSITAESSGN